MKAIYINRYEGSVKKKKHLVFKFLLGLFLLGSIARLIAPYFITEYINKMGKDDSGPRFQVSGVSLKILSSKAMVGNLRVFNTDGSVVLMEFSDGLIDVDPLRFLKKENLASQHWKTGEVILSKYLLQELKNLDTGKKSVRNIFFESLKAHFDDLSVRQVKEENISTVLSLKDTNLKLQNVGMGESKKPTSFEMTSKIKEGGSLTMNGTTLSDSPGFPWDISGNMVNINAIVLDKLVGKEIPIEIKKTDLNAEISASSQAGVIKGTLSLDIKEFKFKEEQSFGIKRTMAKVSNFVLEKIKGKEETVKFEIPFTLNENFTLDIDETLKKIISQ